MKFAHPVSPEVKMELPRLSPAVREMMIVWTFRIAFAMVGVLSVYLLVRGS